MSRSHAHGRRMLGTFVVSVLFAVAVVALLGCGARSESQRQKDEIAHQWNAAATYWNDVVHVHDQLVEDYNAASARADKAKAGLKAPSDYPEELMDAVEAYTGQRLTAGEWRELSKAVIDYVNIAVWAETFDTYAGTSYERAVQSLSSIAAPSRRLARAHRALVQAERKAGRVLSRSAKQIRKAMKMNDGGSISIFFGEGRRVFKGAMSVSSAIDKRETKAWKVWNRTVKAEEKRLRAEASQLGLALPD
jgi:hypothetical protein